MKLTLKQAAESVGYSVAAVNAVELNGEGGDGLKAKLLQLYGMSDTHGVSMFPDNKLHELVKHRADNVPNITRLRIQFMKLEAQMAEMKATLDALKE